MSRATANANIWVGSDTQVNVHRARSEGGDAVSVWIDRNTIFFAEHDGLTLDDAIDFFGKIHDELCGLRMLSESAV
jgi:hypothetical protein